MKKGFDFLRDEENSFTDTDAVVELGVGKNMVDAIRYWLRAFGITDDKDNLQPLAFNVLSTSGYDTYIEDNATLWLLHYLLVRTNRASIYSLIFNEFRKERFEFTRQHLMQFIKRRCVEEGEGFNENTVDSDITVFLRSYLTPSNKGKHDIEDESTGLLQDLSLMSAEPSEDLDTGKRTFTYKIDSQERNELPWQMVLLSILNHPTWGDAINFRELEAAPYSPGLIFALNEKGLYDKIKEMQDGFPAAIVFSNNAGYRTLTVKRDLLPQEEVLKTYYGQEAQSIG
ncbi:DUF4007 family protein [Hymenobacter sp. BT507]|uniref:DUF4007 family protein n=1 Tax=Hymenobacter citatus TaxID=2763506 RepID=A0ABR7MIT3_9BACT|nr:DUF4007 family protein [Hymenobacter citatus]MBC6610961.1 DUF4007 family protein [Hymenobacter citatus]